MRTPLRSELGGGALGRERWRKGAAPLVFFVSAEGKELTRRALRKCGFCGAYKQVVFALNLLTAESKELRRSGLSGLCGNRSDALSNRQIVSLRLKMSREYTLYFRAD